jgi:Zn-dependent protease with chaperone function
MEQAAMEPPAREAGPSRAGLAVLAMGAAAVHQLVQLFPWVFSLGLGALWFNQPFMLWLAAAVAVFLAWLMQPSVRPEGEVLSPVRAPRLHALVEDLRVQLDAPPIDEIRLEEGEFNAAALELGPGLFRWRTRRILFLGVPLLAIVDTAALRAVIAHELGHFSRRHGRLGHWVYRARIGWLSLARQVDEDDSAFDRAMGSFAQWFGPWFARRSFAYSRSCEYEADADAASAVGPATMAGALVRIAMAAARLQKFHAEGLLNRQLHEPEAPRDWTQVQRAAVLGRPVTPQEMQAVLAEERLAPAQTHPATLLRCQALGQRPPDMLPADAVAAGAELLGAAWDEIVRARDERWHGEHHAAWAASHAVRRCLSARREELAAGVPGIEALRLAGALDSPSAVVDQAALLAAGSDALPAEGEFLLGRAMLMQGNAQGVVHLRAGIRLEPTWAAPARAMLAAEGRTFLSEEESRQNSVLLQRARSRAIQAAEAVMLQLLSGKLPAAALAPWQAAAIESGVRVQQGVREAWLFGGRATVSGQHFEACLLVARIETWAAPGVLADEEALAEQLRAVLKLVLPGNCLAIVHTCLATEAIDAGLEKGIAAAPQARLLPPGRLLDEEYGEA